MWPAYTYGQTWQPAPLHRFRVHDRLRRQLGSEKRQRHELIFAHSNRAMVEVDTFLSFFSVSYLLEIFNFFYKSQKNRKNQNWNQMMPLHWWEYTDNGSYSQPLDRLDKMNTFHRESIARANRDTNERWTESLITLFFVKHEKSRMVKKIIKHSKKSSLVTYPIFHFSTGIFLVF